LRKVLALTAAVAAVFFVGSGVATAAPAQPVEVVVTLDAPPLATAIQQSRVLSARYKASRLDLRTPTSMSYLRSLTVAQRAVAASIAATVPGARITWRYQVVLNGLAVLVPRDELQRLASVPGVAEVWPSVNYRRLLDKSPHLIGADKLWDVPAFDTAGNGIKIGIIDDGVDEKHPFFDPGRYTMPPGFPKGNTSYTTAKVIVARAFSPPTNTWKYARVPFDPIFSDHATHVAGIAAGDYSPGAVSGRGPLSGVAPNAYLGNYKVLTVPTENFGLDGNAPEIAAAIEAAVRDGMNVINLSLGEPEIEPTRDLVVAAINAAADAGVVPAIAAGNEFADFGNGSISSPGSAAKAITVAAVSKRLGVSSFSSAGPAPVSLGFKPDVSAPGEEILSSVPPRDGTWETFSGTSMAAPHVAGGAALLLQRHPGWTVAQIKSALVLTGKPTGLGGEAPVTREGGGLVDLVAANTPLIFAAPTDVSFGLLHTGKNTTRSVRLTDAGGGAGQWTVAVAPQTTTAKPTVTAPATVIVPGRLDLRIDAGAVEGDAMGFIVLRFGTVTRRIPYWVRVEDPKLGREPHGTLRTTGTYRSTTAGGRSLVTSYRYPDLPRVAALAGPERVFRVTLTKPVANFGVAVLTGSRASPRVVAAGDENRVVGVTGLPIVINPYIDSYGASRPVAGAIRPARGSYDIVFDTTAATPAAFTFRFWVDDVTPPAVRLLSPTARRGGSLQLSVADGESGVDPASLTARVDGKPATVEFSRGRAVVSLLRVTPGRHALVFSAADYQELKNMENVPQILPNTRTFRAVFRVGTR
jgi:subtilisin family serine protease